MRKVEKKLLVIASSWNLVMAVITIIGYSGWFRDQGTTILNTNNQTNYFTTSLLDSVVRVAMLYGLFIFTVGIIGIYMSRQMDHHLIDQKIIRWLIFCLIISVVSLDVIGILLYFGTQSIN